MDKTETQNVAVEGASPEAASASPDQKPKRQRTKKVNKDADKNGVAQYRVKGQESKDDASAPAEE